MKTQKFSESRLKELMEKGETTTVGPVKKGERFIDEYAHSSGEIEIQVAAMIHNGEKTISQVGEVVQATNEKGEKQFHCKQCNSLHFLPKKNLIFTNQVGGKDVIITPIQQLNHNVSRHVCVLPENALVKIAKFVPLLVRLEKIERETYAGNSKKEFWFETWKVN